MILKLIEPSWEDTAIVELPQPDMVVDPRPICSDDYDIDFKIEVSVNGTVFTLTIIRGEQSQNPGWPYELRFRVYLKTEFHYSFESTIYLFHGLDYERAPRDATEVIVKDGAERIFEYAFNFCRSLSKITIPNTVTAIQCFAFHGCKALQRIQLPPNLQRIGYGAFKNCSLLEAIYIPPTVTIFEQIVFENCKSLRIFNTPADNSKYFFLNSIAGCDGLLTDELKNINPSINAAQNQLIKNRYNPLHNLCWDPSVNAENIQEYIQQHHDNEERARTNDKPEFTTLHLLAANPSVTSQMITTYLQLAPDVATMRDDIGGTPLHMLCSVPCFSDTSGDAIKAYLASEEGRTAAFMKDNEGRTPFDRLCEKDFDELLFLMNKSFGGLAMWWYDCLGIGVFV